MNPFRQMFDQTGGQAPLGTWIMSASPLLTEASGHAGFDWAVLDMEHTPMDLSTLVSMLQATLGTTMVPIVRVPSNDPVTVKRVLDAGAVTVLFPFVQDADEAARAVASTRYPPEGVRGMAGMSRASKFGTTPNYMTTANAGQAVIVQIETPQAMDQLEAIAAVPGVDALFIGPGDLAGTMGLPGQIGHPSVVASMERAAERAHAVGMRIGTVMGTVEQVQHFRAAGYDFVGLASDLGLYMRAATGALRSLRDSAGKKVEGGY
jgi:2-keto-3-deoxy-L-rhamnonate aldolase RhmA